MENTKKNIGGIRLTNVKAKRNLWGFRFKSGKDCVEILWGAMNNPHFFDAELLMISDKLVTGDHEKISRYSKEGSPNSRMSNKTYFSNKLNSDNVGRCELTIKSEDDRSIKLVWRPEKKESTIFLTVDAAGKTSAVENTFIQELADKSIIYARKNLG